MKRFAFWRRWPYLWTSRTIFRLSLPSVCSKGGTARTRFAKDFQRHLPLLHPSELAPQPRSGRKKSYLSIPGARLTCSPVFTSAADRLGGNGFAVKWALHVCSVLITRKSDYVPLRAGFIVREPSKLHALPRTKVRVLFSMWLNFFTAIGRGGKFTATVDCFALSTPVIFP